MPLNSGLGIIVICLDIIYDRPIFWFFPFWYINPILTHRGFPKVVHPNSSGPQLAKGPSSVSSMPSASMKAGRSGYHSPQERVASLIFCIVRWKRWKKGVHVGTIMDIMGTLIEAVSLGIQAHRMSVDEQGVSNHLRNAKYLGSMKPFSVGDWIPRV